MKKLAFVPAILILAFTFSSCGFSRVKGKRFGAAWFQKEHAVKCTNCGSWFSAAPACCDITSTAVLRRATAQGGSGEPHIGQIITMKVLAPQAN